MAKIISLITDDGRQRAAKTFLQCYPFGTARNGERYFNDGRVQRFVATNGHYEAEVQGARVYGIILQYDAQQGWSGTCSCPVGVRCKHIYAAVTHYLKVHAPEEPAANRPKPPSPTADLEDKLRAALGRALKADEQRYLQRLLAAYNRWLPYRQLYYDDLLQLGVPYGSVYRTFETAPIKVNSLEDFWLMLAELFERERFPIPEFMAKITDLEPVRDQIAQWQHQKKIQDWHQRLQIFTNTLTTRRSPTLAAAPEPVELRLMFDNGAAQLEWRVGTEGSFASIPTKKLISLVTTQGEGRYRPTSDALALWQVLSSAFLKAVPTYYYGRAETPNHFPYHDAKAGAALAAVMDLTPLRPLLVNEQGKPLEFAPDPLRWQIAEKAGQFPSYLAQLVQADGSPIPPARGIFSGAKTYYLARHLVYEAPASPELPLTIGAVNEIPAAALETSEGLALLQALHTEPPPALQAKIKQVRLKPRVECSIIMPNAFSRSERCQVVLRAASEDANYIEKYSANGWQPETGQRKPKGLVVFDRALAYVTADTLDTLNLKFDNYTSQYSVRITKNFPEQFDTWLKSVPPETEVVLKGDLEEFRNASVSGQVKLEVSEDGIDWFNLKVVVNVNDTTLTAEEIKLLLNAKGRFVRLPGKGWRRLQFDLTPEDDEQMARLGLSPRELTDTPQRLHTLQLADPAARKFLSDEQARRIEFRAEEIKARVTPPVPAGITAELRPYQVEGFHFLAYLATNHFGGILADDMGLGKTLQTLAWIQWLREIQPKPAPSLVVCPKSVMDNWQAEAKRFVPGVSVKTWSAQEIEALPKQLKTADLHVVNYNHLRMLEGSLNDVRWLAVVLDEGQYIKNPSSQVAQAARSLMAQHRLVLSGTPIENRLLDLWSLMAFAMPGVLGNRAEFARVYDSKTDPLARRRLASRVRPFLLRRTKSQVAKDLPDRIEEDLYCELEGDQKKLYQAELKAAQQLLLKVQSQKELNDLRFNFLTSLLRLRQICCHPALVNPNIKLLGAKTEALMEQLEPLMEEGQKVLVFSQFVELLNLLEPLLEARQWPIFKLTGSTENRGALVESFQNQAGAGVFLLSLKAGGFGLNLTAAGYVVLFDPWWNPAVERQAIDRTHRIGQSRNVIAYRLLIKNSIEEKIRALQKQKASLAEDVLGEEKFAQTLTVDDLRYLFSE